MLGGSFLSGKCFVSMRFLRAIFDECMDVFFPGNCPVCSGPPKMEDGYYTCSSCLDHVAWAGGAACKHCGLPMPSIEYEGLICSSCRTNKPSFNRGLCLFVLDEIGKALIHSIKYDGAREVLNDMRHWLDRCPGACNFFQGAHLVPVPLHQRRESRRGFNQSLWIARAIKSNIGSGVEVGDFMKRTRNTPTQTKLAKKDREKNVKNAFALKPGVCLDSIFRIILIDDVFTTGATLEACTQVWKDKGVDHVDIFTLGHG